MGTACPSSSRTLVEGALASAVAPAAPAATVAAVVTAGTVVRRGHRGRAAGIRVARSARRRRATLGRALLGRAILALGAAIVRDAARDVLVGRRDRVARIRVARRRIA